MTGESGALAVPGNLESVSLVRSWLEELLLRWSVPNEILADIQSAVTEVCTNIVRHGYQPDSDGEIRLEAVRESDRIEITIADDAPAFAPGPEADLPRQRLAEGGYGLFLVKSLMDQVGHEALGRTGNRIRLVKYIPN